MKKNIVQCAHDPDGKSMAEMMGQKLADLHLWAETYAGYKRQEIEAANRSKVNALGIKEKFLMEKREALMSRIAELPIQPTKLGSDIANLTVAVFLGVVGFALAEVTLQPFGWSSVIQHLLALGLAIIVPFAVLQILRHFSARVLMRVFVLAFAGSAIGALFTVSDLRAVQFSRLLDVNDAVVIGDAPQAPAGEPDSKRDQDLLRLAMRLMAIAFEMGAGLALHDFTTARKATNFGLLSSLEKDLLKVEQELLAVVEAKEALLSAPARQYAASMLAADQELPPRKPGRNGMPLLGWVAIALLLLNQWLGAADRFYVIAANDSSITESVETATGKSEFEENSLALAQLFANLPAGSRLTALAVTPMSYASPFVILDAQLSSDPGYLGTRLATGRSKIVSAWHDRTKNLQPTGLHTDLFGLFRYAGEAFARSNAQRKVFAIASDMRNDVAIDLETPQTINVAQSLRDAEKRGLFADLKGVEVYVIGAGEHTGKRNNEYAVALREFYTEYFRRCGATLRLFTTSRDVQGLIDAVAPKQAKASPR